MRRSGIPSPVIAEVGTNETYDRGSGLSQYSSELKPCSANANFVS